MSFLRSANSKVLFGALLLGGISLRGLHHAYALPWPPLSTFSAGPEALQDMSLVVGGFRRLAADMAWVQMLQYMGTSWARTQADEHGHEGHHHDLYDITEKQEGAYGRLKELALRIGWLDPYFKEAYLYAAGILAWSPMVDRPEEAVYVLQEGQRASPDYWPFKTYMAAILYKKQARASEMTHLLEDSIRQPGCPTMVKSILANYYKSQKRYADALRVWQRVLENPSDAVYHDTARRQMDQLIPMLGK